MAGTYYEALGVDERSSLDAIRERYHELAFKYHPDQNRDAPAPVQARLTDLMAELNEAWEVLSDPSKRSVYDASLLGGSDQQGAQRDPPSPPPSSGPPRRPPSPAECTFCGSSPAVRVELHQASGRLIRWYHTKLEAPLCRDCGLAQFRAMQNHTMLAGWWGIISCFASVIFIITNTIAWVRLARLPAPTRDPLVDTPLQHPLAVGTPILLRRGPWVAAVIVALIAFGIAASTPQSSTASTPVSTFDSTSPVYSSGLDSLWIVGGCVSGPAHVAPTGCGHAHYGSIVEIVQHTGFNCPSFANTFATHEGQIYCIDTTH